MGLTVEVEGEDRGRADLVITTVEEGRTPKIEAEGGVMWSGSMVEKEFVPEGLNEDGSREGEKGVFFPCFMTGSTDNFIVTLEKNSAALYAFVTGFGGSVFSGTAEVL